MRLKIKGVETRGEILNFVLEKPIGFIFYPGQYLDVEISDADDPLGKTRAFTISSSPTEDFLMLSIKKGLSIYKKHLLNLKAGDELSASHPVGTFILDETEPAIMVAGGIGITPFRSMLKYVLDQKLTTPITLIYSNSDSNFPFKEELNDWQKEMPNLRIIYHQSTIDGHLNITKLDAAVQHFVTRIFYLAGPPGFVDAMEKILLDMGIDETNIRYDRFDGY